MPRVRITTSVLYCAALVVCLGATPVLAADLKPEDVIARHLDSIGTPEARAAAKTRVMEGAAHFKTLVGGNGLLDGKAVIVSDDRKLQLMLKFSNNQYTGERIITDGDKVEVAASTGGQARSSLGSFVHTQEAIVKEGLLGGVISTAWPLLNVDQHKAKISYEGTKNIDGHSVHDIHYRPKKNTDVNIHLYFDTETFRHVMTVYTLSVRPQMGHHDVGINDVSRPVAGTADSPGGQEITETSEMASARQQETRYRLEERFSDFNKVDGLNLPSHYNIHFTQELGNGATTAFEWDVTGGQVHDNVTLDARNFQVK